MRLIVGVVGILKDDIVVAQEVVLNHHVDVVEMAFDDIYIPVIPGKQALRKYAGMLLQFSDVVRGVATATDGVSGKQRRMVNVVIIDIGIALDDHVGLEEVTQHDHGVGPFLHIDNQCCIGGLVAAQHAPLTFQRAIELGRDLIGKLRPDEN